MIYSNDIRKRGINDITIGQIDVDWNGIHRGVLFSRGNSQISERRLCTAEKLNDQVGQHRHDLVRNSNFKR